MASEILSPLAMSILGLALPGKTGTFLLLVLGLSFVIFVHELGHFLVARWCDVRIERFAIGFGKELFGFTRKQIRYSFNILPLGGYVKMLGQEDFAVDKAGELYVKNDPRAYSNKPVGQRMMIVSAGVVMNVIFASILFMIAFMIGMRVIPARIGTVLPDTPAWRAGLRPGDQILTINGASIDEMADVMMAITLADPDTVLKMRVLQDGHERAVSLEPEYNAIAGLRQISISNPQSLTVAYTGSAGGPPENQQLQVDDEIIALQGKPVTDIDQVLRSIAAAQGGPVELTVKRPVKDGDGEPVLDESGKQVTKEVTVCRRARITMLPASDPNLLGAVPRMRIGDASAGNEINEMDLVIAKVLSDSPMSKAGVVDGGRITAVNGRSVSDWFALIDTLKRNGGNVVQLTFEADGRVHTGELTVPRSTVLDLELPPWPDGVIVSIAGKKTAMANGPDGKPREHSVGMWEGVKAALEQDAGRQVEIEYLIGGEPHKKSIFVTPDGTDPWTMRVSYAETLIPYPEMKLLTITNPATAMWLGVKRTGYFLIQVCITTRQMLFTQQIGEEQMSGPVGIIRIGTQIASAGPAQLIYFLAFLSVNFALVNFLPFPIVDGGHFFFLLIEKIKGKPLSVRTQMMTQGLGLAMVFVAFIFLTIQDVLLWHKS